MSAATDVIQRWIDDFEATAERSDEAHASLVAQGFLQGAEAASNSTADMMRTLASVYKRLLAEVVEAEGQHVDELEHSRDFWACRAERIKDLGREHGIYREVCTILANGTAEPHEPPTYAQRLNTERYKREVAEKRERYLAKTLEDLSCDGCEYGDNCPDGANHYVCRPCQMQRALDEAKEIK